MADKNKKTQSKVVNFEEAKAKKAIERNQNSLPQIRQIPEWKSTEMLEVQGIEWQAIATHFESINNAFMAFHSVINRNLVNGKIKMRFQKLENDQYVDMTAEEEAPYQQEFTDMLNQANRIAADSIKQSQPDLAPRIDAIVNENGVPYEDIEDKE